MSSSSFNFQEMRNKLDLLVANFHYCVDSSCKYKNNIKIDIKVLYRYGSALSDAVVGEPCK